MSDSIPFTRLIKHVVDNRGKTCPIADKGLPLIATNCVKNTTLYPVFEKIRYVDEQTYQTWFRGHPLPGDLIFVTKGSPGQVCIAPDPVGFCIAQDMVALRANDKLVYPPYLFAALRSKKVQNEILNMHVGTMIPHFKKGDFDKLFIDIPDMQTQIFVGDVHLAIENKIELNRRMNETLELMAQAIFRDWFVDFGPVRRKQQGTRDPIAIMGGLVQDAARAAELAALFPDAFGDDGLPEGWRLSDIGQFMEILDNRRIPLSGREREQRRGRFPYYGAAGILDHVDAFLFDGVHLLLGEDGSVITEKGKPVLQYVWGQFWVNNHAHVIRGRNVSTEHLYCHLSTVEISPFVTGAVQPKVSQSNLKSIPFLVVNPSINESFSELIEAIFAKIRANKVESEALVEARDYLLPKLMSGEVRVRDAESIAEAAL